MEAKDFRNLQEAYREVYQELDEADDLESLQSATQSSVDRMKKGNRITRAGAHIAANKVERDVKKASAYGPQRPKAGQTGAYRIGEEHLNEISADTALVASKEAGKRAGILAGLSGGDPKVKEKAVRKREQAERLYTASAKRRLKVKVTPVKITREEYDFILSHLIDEGYTNTFDGARVIASNMSDEWIVSILDEGEKPLPYGRMMKKSNELADSGDKKNQKRAAKIYTAANAPKGPKVKIR